MNTQPRRAAFRPAVSDVRLTGITNPVVVELQAVLRLGGLYLRQSDNAAPSRDGRVVAAIWSENDIDEDGSPIPGKEEGELVWQENNPAFDQPAAIIEIFTVQGSRSTTAIAQLAQLVKLCRDTALYNDPDLQDLKFVYRKVNDRIETDVVGQYLNWWNYVDEQGRKVQALFSEELHTGPDIEKVLARFVYDPARNLLQARPE